MTKRTGYPDKFIEALVAEVRLGQSTIAQVLKRENSTGQMLLISVEDRTSCNTKWSAQAAQISEPAEGSARCCLKPLLVF
jgi:hypothetical protein